MNSNIRLSLIGITCAYQALQPCFANQQNPSEPRLITQPNPWYVVGFGGFVKSDAARGGDGYQFGIGIGKVLNEHFNIELKGFYNGGMGQDFIDSNQVGKQICTSGSSSISGLSSTTSCHQDDGKRSDLSLGGGSLDVQYFWQRGEFSPYAVIGAGLMNTHSRLSQNDALGFVGEAGLGLLWQASSSLWLRGDVRYRYNQNFGNALSSDQDQFHDVLFNLGVLVPFGN